MLSKVQLARPMHAQRLTEHILAQLVCLGRHTITGLLCVNGQQFRDWSAIYRLFSQNRMSPEMLFNVALGELCALDNGPVVAAMDDTGLRRTGRKTAGTSFMRDPLGPPFHVNLIRAQRYIQSSIAIKGPQGQARMVPVDWVHAPLPPKPSRKASELEHKAYRQQREKARLSLVGVQRMQYMRQWLDDNGARHRRLWQIVDGSYTNGTVLGNLPHNTTLVGRINKHAKLYHLPQQQPAKGRRRVYGELAPTPEALRQDQNHPWQTLEVFFGGERRILRVKKLGPLRWRAAGERHNLQLVVIAPTGYRLSKQSPTLYRQPAYLICTDPEAPLQEVVQHYLWRWDIEVNFRDEKTLIGVGEAQVRKASATQNVTGTAVAAYALLLLAAHKCRQKGLPHEHLPLPRWRNGKPRRATTSALIQNLRYELWGHAIHFSGFAVQRHTKTNPEKCKPNLQSAVCYASNY